MLMERMGMERKPADRKFADAFLQLEGVGLDDCGCVDGFFYPGQNKMHLLLAFVLGFVVAVDAHSKSYYRYWRRFHHR